MDGIRESIDCSLTFFGHPVSVGVMYAVLIGAILLLTGVLRADEQCTAAAPVAQTALSPPTDSAGHTNQKRPARAQYTIRKEVTHMLTISHLTKTYGDKEGSG